MNVFLDVVAGRIDQFPTNNLPEFAMVGKSNVGKSSLINAMVCRKALARTSNTPGKTRTINFYNIDERLYLVDLPGYGYARASKVDIQKWSRLIENYLQDRIQLQKIILLIDIRHAPGKNDLIMHEWLTFYKKEMLIVATKSDKLTQNQIATQIDNFKSIFKNDEVISVSSQTKSNIEMLWAKINL